MSLPPQEGPKVEAKPALIAEAGRRRDFGAVVSRPGRTAPHAYRFVNTTANVVNLLNVINRKTCCGSVRAEKLRLGPGDSADVEATLHLDNRFGDVVNETEVVTDLPADERVVLRTSATTVMFLRVEPVSLPDGPLLAGMEVAPRAAFQVFAAGDASEPPIDLDRVAGPGVHGRAASSAPAPTQIVVVKGAPKPGIGRGVVAISTDHPAIGKIEVPFIVLD